MITETHFNIQVVGLMETSVGVRENGFLKSMYVCYILLVNEVIFSMREKISLIIVSEVGVVDY